MNIERNGTNNIGFFTAFNIGFHPIYPIYIMRSVRYSSHFTSCHSVTLHSIHCVQYFIIPLRSIPEIIYFLIIIHLSSLILSSFFYHFTFFIPIFLDFFLIFSIFFFKGPINSIELFIGINPCYSILFINFFSLFFYIFFIILFSFYYFLVFLL